jgi:RHS repeat-associated protein
MPDPTYSTEPSTSPLANTFDNVDQNYRNSFHWGPLQYANLQHTLSGLDGGDYAIAHMNHWLGTTDVNDPSDTLSLERAPSPDRIMPGQLTWYDYNGKPTGHNNFMGTSGEPSFVAVVLPDATTRFTHYSRNVLGLVTQTTDTYSLADGSVGQRVNSFYYRASNNIDLQQWVGPNGEQVLSNYFSTVNVIHEPDATYDALNQQTAFTYNGNGQVTQVTRPSGLTTVNTYASAGVAKNRLTNTVDVEIKRTNSFAYYANGLVNTHTDERGLTTTSYWDNLQRLTGMSYPDGSAISNLYLNLDLVATKDRLTNWTYYVYNPLRQKIAETNANGVITLYSYCECGALMAVTNAFNTTAQIWLTNNYDFQGNLTNTSLPDLSMTNWFDSMQRVYASFGSRGYRYYFYNNQGLLTNLSNLYGTERATVFDNEDRPIYVTDANGVTVTNTYDLISRLTSRKYPDTGNEKFGYSARGLIAYTNQIGASNFFVLDQAGRKNFETNANGELLQFYYNSAGDLTNLVDGKGHSVKWGFDPFGRVTNKLDQTGATILQYAYDSDNRLTNRWTPQGNAAFSFDPVGNLTNVAYSGGLTPSVSYGFDALNRLTNMVDSVGTTVYAYTPGGELFTEDGPFASDTVTNTYLNRLRAALALQQLSGAWTNGFIYDAASRLTNVTSQAGPFGYNFALAGVTLPGSMLRGISLPNTAYITNQYDPLARLTGTFLLNSGGATLDYASYGYNLASQRTSFTSGPGNVQYGYDKIGQLKVATSTVNGENRGYAYDSAWNLNFRTNNGVLGTFVVDTKNELTNAPTPMGTMLYDANGNLTSANGHYLYSYDAENRLTMWIYTQLGLNSLTNGDLVSTFAYDGLGRLRIRDEYILNCPNPQSPQPPSGSAGAFPAPPAGCNWDLTSETHYIYDGYRVIQERDSNNVPVVSYTRGTDLSGTLEGAGGIGGLLGRSSGYSGGNWTSHAYYHADGNGNITYLVDGSQNLAASYRYDPFGNTVSSSGTLANANVYRFSSKEIHANSGMYYFLYRFYDPNLQRWVNRDPVAEAGGINLYGFLGNSPIDYSDPFGDAVYPNNFNGPLRPGDIRGPLLPDPNQRPPGYNPSWPQGQNKWGPYVEDPSTGERWHPHPDDPRHWPHYDAENSGKSYPEQCEKPRPGQYKNWKPRQSRTDPWPKPEDPQKPPTPPFWFRLLGFPLSPFFNFFLPQEVPMRGDGRSTA